MPLFSFKWFLCAIYGIRRGIKCDKKKLWCGKKLCWKFSSKIHFTDLAEDVVVKCEVKECNVITFAPYIAVVLSSICGFETISLIGSY